MCQIFFMGIKIRFCCIVIQISDSTHFLLPLGIGMSLCIQCVIKNSLICWDCHTRHKLRISTQENGQCPVNFFCVGIDILIHYLILRKYRTIIFSIKFLLRKNTLLMTTLRKVWQKFAYYIPKETNILLNSYNYHI